MAKSSKVLPHALRLSSYGELEAYVRAFAAGHLHLLLLFGPPGVGKSRAVRSVLDPPTFLHRDPTYGQVL